jgi:hypothetical protein
MALYIQTTGLDDYAPGGKARVKVLVVGGPGVGKTRWSSYFPDPIYADCEGGLASVADRQVAYSRINTSDDMLDLLAFLKQDGKQPVAKRTYQTIVVDTLDAFQRKVKNEWMEKEKKQVFTGWEAWGYLNSKMQLLMTRLLNLDMNVIVAVHYKDKTTKDDESGKETHTLMLQLNGELTDTAFNDFDLVGWMGVYWEAVEGERVQKRGLTFKPTPDKPFLKDRLHVTPPWMEVKFAESDYTILFEAIQARIADLPTGEVVGEIPREVPEVSAFVIPPGAMSSGPLPGAGVQAPLTYQQRDKPTLAKMCHDRGISTTVDGVPLKGNTLKNELIAALEANDAQRSASPATGPAAAPEDPAPEAGQPEQLIGDKPTELPKEVANTRRTRVATVAEGTVNMDTGELVQPSIEDAISTVKEVLGGVVTKDPEPQAPEPEPEPTPPPRPVVAPAIAKTECEVCGKDLTEQNPDTVKLSWIKFRKRLCEEDFQQYKAGARR